MKKQEDDNKDKYFFSQVNWLNWLSQNIEPISPIKRQKQEPQQCNTVDCDVNIAKNGSTVCSLSPIQFRNMMCKGKQ